MTQQAIIHRMVLPDHICPYGLKAKQLLESLGFAVDDRPLTTRAEVDAFKAAHGLKTTPLIFIDGVRIGGYDDLRRHLGLEPDNSVVPLHSPAIALIAATALAALSMTQTWF
jgi:glutaredoxin